MPSKISKTKTFLGFNVMWISPFTLFMQTNVFVTYAISLPKKNEKMHLSYLEREEFYEKL